MRSILVSSLLVALCATANADEKLNVEPERKTAAAKARPGPALWKVTRADGHILWLLGTVNPKPHGLKWDSTQIDEAIKSSQLLLRQSNELPAGIEIELYTLDPLQRMRAALHDAHLEEEYDTPLKEVLPPDLYVRYQTQQEKLLPKKTSARRLEKMRPRTAANRLYDEAIEDAGLSTRAVTHEQVERIARRHNLKIESITLQIQLNLRNYMEVTAELSERPPQSEVGCMAVTLAQIETQLPIMSERAHAWAAGDVQKLSELPYLTRDACSYAPWNAPRWKDLPQRLSKHWLETVEAAMQKHRSTFVLIDISELLKPDGLLAALKNKGYQVLGP